MIDFGTVHFFPTETNPVYIKQQELPAGWCVDTHTHKYDHWALLGAGTVRLEVEGEDPAWHQGPCVIDIKAGKSHKITALTSIRWFCIHHSTETDVSKIDETLIKGG